MYTDIGLLTCNEEIGLDVCDVFKYLTGYHRQKGYRKLVVAPAQMRRDFCRLIDQVAPTTRTSLLWGFCFMLSQLDLVIEDGFYSRLAGLDICVCRPARGHDHTWYL